MSDAQWRRTWAAVGITALVAFTFWVLSASDWDVVIVLQYAVAGLGPGAAAALVGVGLALTYQTTGVFNFAFGAMATFCAYVLWQWTVGWHLPMWLGTPIVVFGVGPGLGLLLERAVFRPLQRRAASTSEKLLASIAVFAVVLGVTVVIWQTGTRLNAPRIFGTHPFRLLGDRFSVASATVGSVLTVAVCAIGVTWLLQRTTLGVRIRAVVDRRQLAELVGVRANRVAATAWAIGGGFAALAGVLYAPQQGLSPYGLTLLVLETFAVVVIARLTNLTLAIVGGLALGVVQSMMVRVQPQIVSAWPGLQQVEPYLFVLALPLFLLVWRNLDELGSESSAAGIVSSSIGRRRRRNRLVGPGTIAAVALVALGFVLQTGALATVQRMVALTVVFLSIVAITGFSGHITLGQAAFAGMGALLTVKISNGALPGVPKLDALFAMLLSGVVVMVLGLATGYPALRRRGLILGLATLAMNLAIYFMVLENAYFLTSTEFGNRPHLLGVSLTGDRAFYLYELVVLAGALLLTGSLRSGRLGRVLAAMRDSETGAMSVGINLRRYKLFIFAASSFLAAIGGSLLAQQAQTFDGNDWSPLISLFWFVAVVFAGLSYLSGAAVAAVLYVGLDQVLGRGNASVVVIGVLTLLTISFMRGGLVGWLLGLAGGRGVPDGLRERYRAAVAYPAEPSLEESAPVPTYAPSPLARRLLAGARR